MHYAMQDYYTALTITMAEILACQLRASVLVIPDRRARASCRPPSGNSAIMMWTPKVNPAVWVTVLLVFYVLANSLPSKHYGEVIRDQPLSGVEGTWRLKLNVIAGRVLGFHLQDRPSLHSHCDIFGVYGWGQSQT